MTNSAIDNFKTKINEFMFTFEICNQRKYFFFLMKKTTSPHFIEERNGMELDIKVFFMKFIRKNSMLILVQLRLIFSFKIRNFERKKYH